MNSTNRQLSVESTSQTDYRYKEQTMLRHFVTVILCSLALAIFTLSAAPVLAQGAVPSDMDRMDEAYLEEYNQRAKEKYAAMLATQAAKTADINAASVPDWGGEMFLEEYNQRAEEKYASMLATQAAKTATVNAASMPDWGGEIFLEEYNQRAREKYASMLAMQKARDHLMTGAIQR